jgi:hypothetical protein
VSPCLREKIREGKFLYALALIIPLILFAVPPLRGEPLYSPSWGFYLDLPEGYGLSGGDGKDRFAFQSPGGACFDLVVYAPGRYPSAEGLAEDAARRIGNRGERSPFDYNGKEAALLELDFPDPGAAGGRNARTMTGWGLALELEAEAGNGRPLLLALAYGPADQGELLFFHLSALDSIAPSAAERRIPGPLSAFSYPRGKPRPVALANSGETALIAEHDAEGAQALVDREYEVLRRYAQSSLWREAWTRFYRAVYRDSFDRLADAAFALERKWYGGDRRDFAGKALAWVQSFYYERNLQGSDFVNLVSAAAEGRGDCDSRALLWAIILERANIPAGIMVSPEYSHAMGLADLEGPGARFESGGKKWLVAETTAPAALGLIGQDNADPAQWLGVLFE